MARKRPDRLYQFVEDLVALGVRRLTAGRQVEETAARAVMREVAGDLCDLYARTSIYVPLAVSRHLIARDAEVWRKYHEDGVGADGSPGARRCTCWRIDELAAEYSLTARQVYSIVGAMRKAPQGSPPAPDAPGAPDPSAG